MLLFDPFAPFDTFTTRGTTFLPPVDIAVSEKDLVLTMDLRALTA